LAPGVNTILLQKHICRIRDGTQIGSARRSARTLAQAIHLDEVLIGNVGIVATELASNMLKHAGGGDLFIQTVTDGSFKGIEFVAVDSGPGVGDITRALQDGHSTAGTPGTGLGAVRRLSSLFDLHSDHQKGTVVLSRIGSGRPSRSAMTWGSAASNAPGESVSGDQWSLVHREDGATLMVVDALGHGVLANEAALVAVRAFEDHGTDAPGEFVNRAHDALRGGRGAALAVARCDLARNTITYAGVGNVAGVIVRLDGRQHGLVSNNGTVGSATISVREFEYEWRAGETLVMHTDGLRTRWLLSDRPGLTMRHPSVVAAVLHRDFLRGRDDATVVVVSRTGKHG
jgi:anti-sigma regulatory factor (Ser/Thr protein kinase)